MGAFLQVLNSNRSKLWIFIPLVILYAISYFHRTGIPGTIFNELAKEGFTAEGISMLTSCFIMVYSFSQLISGFLADKYSGIRVVMVGGFIFCVGAILFPFCHTILLMSCCRVIIGLGASTMFLSLVRESERLFGRANFSVCLGLIYFIGYIGGVCGSYPFERINHYFYWRHVMIVLGIFSVVMYIIFMLAASKNTLPKPSNIPINFSPLLYIIKNPYSWLLCGCSCINFGVNSIIVMFCGKKILEDCGKYSSATASIVLSCMTLVCMTLLLLAGIFIRMLKNRRKPLMISSNITTFLSTIFILSTLYFGLPRYFLVIAFIMYAIASAGTIGYALVSQEVNSKDIMTLTTGFNNMINYFFVAIGSFLIGRVLNSFLPKDFAGGNFTYPLEAYMIVFWLILVISGIGLILMLFAPETRGHYFRLRITSQK